jgi:hypothetical protein
MAGSESEKSKTPRHLYRELRRAGVDRETAEQMARDSISKRRVSERPDDVRTTEKGEWASKE